MIKFFRKIRQNLLSEGNTGKYLKYAFGEILLVVIGILIALTINNWNDNRKSKLTEIKYVNDLIEDLNNDVIALKEFTVYLESKKASKRKLESFLENKEGIDSIEFHIVNQYILTDRFTPSNITIEELKNSGGLKIIRNVDLRRQIVSMYNSYSKEVHTEDLFLSQNLKLLDIASEYFKNVSQPSIDEINLALEDNKFINGIYTNFAKTREEAINDLHSECLDLIKNLEKYKDQINQ